MKKAISLVLALLMIFTLVACGKTETPASTSTAPDPATPVGPAAPAEQAEQTELVIGVTADPETLIPWGPGGAGRQILTWNIYEYLFDIDGFGGGFTGILAKDYERVDASTYRVFLYDGIHDTNDNPVKASDVKFSFETCMELGASARNVANIESIEAEDDTTVVFHFSSNMDENKGLFEEIMMNTYIVSQKSYEDAGDGMAKNAVGTSGYRVKEYVSGSYISFERTGNYWQTDANAGLPNSQSVADSLKYVFISDQNQRAIALQSGQVDISSNLSSADLSTFAEGGQYANSFTVDEKAENKVLSLYFNCDASAITGNANLRKALAYCFDSDAILKSAYGGYAKKVFALSGTDRYPDYNTEWDGREYFDYNLDTAKDYLNKYCEESGQKPEDITIRILCQNSGVYENAALVLQSYISQLGVTCEINSRETNIAETEKFDPSLYEIYLYSYANTTYWVACLNTAMGMNQSLNEGKSMYFVEDPELQARLEAALLPEATDTELGALDEYINEQCYAVGIGSELKQLVYANWVKDITVDRKVSVVGGAAEFDWAEKSAWSVK